MKHTGFSKHNIPGHPIKSVILPMTVDVTDQNSPGILGESQGVKESDEFSPV